jgi:hypothetical protein
VIETHQVRTAVDTDDDLVVPEASAKRRFESRHEL